MTKYKAQSTVIDGVRFASKKEAKRYQELRLLERAGEVKELELQPKFPLYVCRGKNGELHQVCHYIADFQYREGPRGVLVIEDVKSKATITPIYRLKKKMFEFQYQIQIRETF